MDKITQVRFFVDDIAFVSDLFTKCLGFEVAGGGEKTVKTFRMLCGTEVLIYDSRKVYPEGDVILKLTIDDAKIDIMKKYLEELKVKFFYKEKHEFGINRVLNLQLNNGSMIDFVSEE